MNQIQAKHGGSHFSGVFQSGIGKHQGSLLWFDFALLKNYSFWVILSHNLGVRQCQFLNFDVLNAERSLKNSL